MYISILDYSTSNVCIIHDADDLTKDLLTEDIEALLESIGFHVSNISYMISVSEPGPASTTLAELCDDNYQAIEQACIERLKSR